MEGCLPTWAALMRSLVPNSRKVNGDTFGAVLNIGKVTRGLADNDNDMGKGCGNDVSVEKLLGGEPSFDSFTTIVRNMLHVPIAVVCLIQDKQLHETIERRRKSNSSRSIHPIIDPFYLALPEGKDVYVIPNCRKHRHICESKPVVGAPYIRFYAGMFVVPKTNRDTFIVKVSFFPQRSPVLIFFFCAF